MVSLSLWLLVFFKDFLENLFATICPQRNCSDYNPGEHRRLLSPENYRQQGEDHTAKALEQLRQYVAKNPRLASGFGEGTELKLRRFSQGGPHACAPHDFNDGDERGSRCTLL